MSNLHFDHHQFERRSVPVNGKNGISFDDAKRMQTQSRSTKPAAWVPPFAMSDAKLQKVLLVRAWRYVHGSACRKLIPHPESINREEINRAATAKALRGYTIRPDAPAIQHQAHAMHQASVRLAGGFLQLMASIAFRSWRLGMDSVAVAETLGTSPQAVRASLWRFREIAKRLGFDVGPAGSTAGMKRAEMTKRERSAPRVSAAQRVIALYKAGVPLPEIAVAVGWQRYENRVRWLLRSAGYPIPYMKMRLDAEPVIVPRKKIQAVLGTEQERKSTTGRKGNREFSAPRAVELYKAGWKIAHIAMEMGYRRGQGHNRVRRYLRIAGVYKEKPGHTGPALNSVQAAS